MKKKVIVVDLDGTLLDTNTFHKWIFFCLRKSVFVNFLHTFKITYFIFLRVIRNITHKELKYKILKITQRKEYENHIQSFLEILEKYENKKVLNFMTDKNSVYILATAAPEVYVKPLIKKYNFTYVIATPSIHSIEWTENIRENKEINLLRLLKKEGFSSRIEMLITDHYDDIYLAKHAKKTILIYPSTKTIQVFEKKKIDYTLL